MQKTNSQYTWDLSGLFSGDEAQVQADLEAVKVASYTFIDKYSKDDSYLSDAKALNQALDDFEAWIRQFGTDGRVGYYFSLLTALDQSDPELKAKDNQILDFATKILNDIQFFELRLAKISEQKQQDFLADPLLADYKHYLEKIFREGKYQLSEAEEKIVNMYAPMAKGNWVKMVSGFIYKEELPISLPGNNEEKVIGLEEAFSLLSGQDQETRDAAAVVVNTILDKYVDVAEAELNSVLQTKKVSDELRKFERPDASRHLHDDIETEVVDSMLEAVEGAFDVSARFYAVKARLLGKPKLAYHERNVEVGEIEQDYSFESAIQLVDRALGNVDPRFAEILQMYVQNNQIDVFPRQHKKGGAFCAHNLITQPTFILLNYTDKLRDVLTLAHEVGHGINNELMKAEQNALNFGSPVSTAEVASTFMEDFVFQELLANADDRTKFALLMGRLNDEISTIHRQVAAYRFEQSLHSAFRDKGYLSKQDIGDLFQKHMSAYMGDAVEQSAGSENWWVYWSHIRNSFYVYSYASGLLVSKAMQNQVKQDKKYVEKVKQFLASGTSASPKESFLRLGIDISNSDFWLTGLAEVRNSLSEAEALAEKLQLW